MVATLVSSHYFRGGQKDESTTPQTEYVGWCFYILQFLADGQPCERSARARERLRDNCGPRGGPERSVRSRGRRDGDKYGNGNRPEERNDVRRALPF